MLRPRPYPPIADYAIIGDGRTAALVSRDGSIDWLCLPRFDADPVSSRILDADLGGYWCILPHDARTAQRSYRDRTNVLETFFTTTTGQVRLTDFSRPSPRPRNDTSRSPRRFSSVASAARPVASPSR